MHAHRGAIRVSVDQQHLGACPSQLVSERDGDRRAPRRANGSPHGNDPSGGHATVELGDRGSGGTGVCDRTLLRQRGQRGHDVGGIGQAGGVDAALLPLRRPRFATHEQHADAVTVQRRNRVAVEVAQTLVDDGKACCATVRSGQQLCQVDAAAHDVDPSQRQLPHQIAVDRDLWSGNQDGEAFPAAHDANGSRTSVNEPREAAPTRAATRDEGTLSTTPVVALDPPKLEPSSST